MNIAQCAKMFLDRRAYGNRHAIGEGTANFLLLYKSQQNLVAIVEPECRLICNVIRTKLVTATFRLFAAGGLAGEIPVPNRLPPRIAVPGKKC